MRTIKVVEIVEAQWDALTDETASSEGIFSLHTLIKNARSNPVLSELYPFLSVGRLCFSRCIQYPYYVDVLITPRDSLEEDYLVEKTVGQGGWADTAPVKRACSAKAATQIAASLLPDTYGPARVGDANQWRDDFNQVAMAFRELTPRSDDH